MGCHGPLGPPGYAYVTTSFHSLQKIKWTDSHSRIEAGVTVVSCRINRLLFADDLALMPSSQKGLQHALDR